MRRKSRFDVKSFMLLFLIVLLALLMLYFLKQMQTVDLLIMKSQKNEQSKVEKLESRVEQLEDLVILQGKIIMGLEELKPLPEKSKKAPEVKKTSSKVDTNLDLLPEAVVGGLMALKTLLNPVKTMLSY